MCLLALGPPTSSHGRAGCSHPQPVSGGGREDKRLPRVEDGLVGLKPESQSLFWTLSQPRTRSQQPRGE